MKLEARDLEGKVILLVEDCPDDAALTLRALRKNRIRSKVVVARDGAEALEYLFGAPGELHAGALPHVVLLDLKLPKVDGMEVLRRIRSSEKTRLLSVVVLTSSREERDVLDVYRLGANSYIRKPVDYSMFTEAMGSIIHYWLGLNEPPPETPS